MSIKDLDIYRNFKFIPSDIAIIDNFLIPKLRGSPNPDDPAITIENPYSLTPEKLLNELKHPRCKRNEGFFYTTRTHENTYETSNGNYMLTCGCGEEQDYSICSDEDDEIDDDDDEIDDEEEDDDDQSCAGEEFPIVHKTNGDDDQEVGFTRILRFYLNTQETPIKTDWYVHEYRVNPDLHPEKLADVVMCKIVNYSDNFPQTKDCSENLYLDSLLRQNTRSSL